MSSFIVEQLFIHPNTAQGVWLPIRNGHPVHDARHAYRYPTREQATKVAGPMHPKPTLGRYTRVAEVELDANMGKSVAFHIQDQCDAPPSWTIPCPWQTKLSRWPEDMREAWKVGDHAHRLYERRPVDVFKCDAGQWVQAGKTCPHCKAEPGNVCNWTGHDSGPLAAAPKPDAWSTAQRIAAEVAEVERERKRKPCTVICARGQRMQWCGVDGVRCGLPEGRPCPCGVR